MGRKQRSWVGIQSGGLKSQKTSDHTSSRNAKATGRRGVLTQQSGPDHCIADSDDRIHRKWTGIRPSPPARNRSSQVEACQGSTCVDMPIKRITFIDLKGTTSNPIVAHQILQQHIGMEYKYYIPCLFDFIQYKTYSFNLFRLISFDI